MDIWDIADGIKSAILILAGWYLLFACFYVPKIWIENEIRFGTATLYSARRKVYYGLCTVVIAAAVACLGSFSKWHEYQGSVAVFIVVATLVGSGYYRGYQFIKK